MEIGDGGRVLVTGGSGFIGTNVVEQLRAAGTEVANLDSAAPRSSGHGDLWRRASLLDGAATKSVVSEFQPTHVVHLAARTDLQGSDLDDYPANTVGTKNLLAALAGLARAPRLIVASTRMVCPIGYQPLGDEDWSPPNAYGESKVETERIVRAAAYPGAWMIVRPTSIWGPWFGVPYRDFFLAVARGRYRHPGGATVLKSFGYVENTVHQLISLLVAPDDKVMGRLFYLADYEPIEILDWATRIRSVAGAAPVRTVPLGLLRVAAAGGTLLQSLGWREPPLTRFRLRNLLTRMLYDLQPVRELVPELPVSTDVGVRRTVEWLRSSGDLPQVAA